MVLTIRNIVLFGGGYVGIRVLSLTSMRVISRDSWEVDGCGW
jgi:hypothetical protein